MNSKLEPTIWSCDTGQQKPYFDSCLLTLTWVANVKEGNYKPRVNVSVNLLAEIQPPSVPVVMQTCPRVILLAMITMTKSMHGFPLLYYMGTGLSLAVLWAPRVPLYQRKIANLQNSTSC